MKWQEAVKAAAAALPATWEEVLDNHLVLAIGIDEDKLATLHKLHCMKHCGDPAIAAQVVKMIEQDKVLDWWPAPFDLLSVYSFLMVCHMNRYLGDVFSIKDFMREQFNARE
jgi:hypothetical protein